MRMIGTSALLLLLGGCVDPGLIFPLNANQMRAEFTSAGEERDALATMNTEQHVAQAPDKAEAIRAGQAVYAETVGASRETASAVGDIWDKLGGAGGGIGATLLALFGYGVSKRSKDAKRDADGLRRERDEERLENARNAPPPDRDFAAFRDMLRQAMGGGTPPPAPPSPPPAPA